MRTALCRAREAGGHADHVLFGDEAFRETFTKLSVKVISATQDWFLTRTFVGMPQVAELFTTFLETLWKNCYTELV
jgi:hypothetical protein